MSYFRSRRGMGDVAGQLSTAPSTNVTVGKDGQVIGVMAAPIAAAPIVSSGTPIIGGVVQVPVIMSTSGAIAGPVVTPAPIDPTDNSGYIPTVAPVTTVPATVVMTAAPAAEPNWLLYGAIGVGAYLLYKMSSSKRSATVVVPQGA